MPTPRLLRPTVCYDELLAAMRQARQRIAISAMIGLWDTVTQPLFEAALDGAQRGLDVHIMFDRFGMGPIGEGNLRLSPSFWRQRAATLAALEELQAAGARVSLIGTFKSPNPYKGRYHAKIYLADNRYFSFGGINCS
ncbi:MAG TPA: phospholipase D-like domain-containing protein, partial [Ktedonobacteraceae bacterium]|nr:phospholipase D-like domain-containing protein [Ktedonobacteraceae bacterium]